jgi:hypothetical protein
MIRQQQQQQQPCCYHVDAFQLHLGWCILLLLLLLLLVLLVLLALRSSPVAQGPAARLQLPASCPAL